MEKGQKSRQPDIVNILKKLEEIATKAESVKEVGKRRKILPLPYQVAYLKKLVKRIESLRNGLMEKEREMGNQVCQLSQRALEAYQAGLDKIK